MKKSRRNKTKLEIEKERRTHGKPVLSKYAAKVAKEAKRIHGHSRESRRDPSFS